MEDWQADETQTVEDGCTSWCTALLWIVPAKVEGTWSLGSGQLDLKQQFQMLSGTLDGKPIADGRLRGDEIQFTVGGVKYAGKVNGSSMSGTTTGSAGGSWKATKAGTR